MDPTVGKRIERLSHTATDGLVSIKRAAETLQITRASVYAAIDRGSLIRVYIDSKPFITLASLSKYKKRKYNKKGFIHSAVLADELF